MFCYQCEQTGKGIACTTTGVCGKDPVTAALQDVLVETVKGIAQYAHHAASLGLRDADLDRFTLEALFATVTNVQFDPERLVALIQEAAARRDQAKAMYATACAERDLTMEPLAGPAVFEPAATTSELVAQAADVSITVAKEKLGDDLAGLYELILYGLKGAAAYLDHAIILGVYDPEVAVGFYEVLTFLTEEHSVAEATAMALQVGELNLKVMGLLDQANTDAYGHPEPTQVRVSPVKGKCILVSGHDLKALEELLKQTAGKGINVYTHSEMLPALAYPGLKKYPHLVGNFGSAWQNQRAEFSDFPGAFLFNTNCIQKPKDDYLDRVFTTDVVGWPGVTHVQDFAYAPVIEAALAAPGFAEDAPEQFITIGFGRHAVLGVADKVIDAVKSGAIKHFFLIGGCDGAKPGRNYYTDFAQAVPDDCVILTLACGKYRFNKLEFGDIGGIPRLLDIGQCNDAYSAIQIAVALAEAFETDVNSLPLSFILSWFEQKAVAILLTLLHLGIKNMRLGPTLPAFVTPAVLQVLVDNFNIAPITTVETDLAACLA
ncbi:MAG TPA: hydroxylamine reductase [bacterium]|nr:hydroxylamine reductase [bacterium]